MDLTTLYLTGLLVVVGGLIWINRPPPSREMLSPRVIALLQRADQPDLDIYGLECLVVDLEICEGWGLYAAPLRAQLAWLAEKLILDALANGTPARLLLPPCKRLMSSLRAAYPWSRVYRAVMAAELYFAEEDERLRAMP